MSSGICILYDVYYVTGVFVQMYSMIIGYADGTLEDSSMMLFSLCYSI